MRLTCVQQSLGLAQFLPAIILSDVMVARVLREVARLDVVGPSIAIMPIVVVCPSKATLTCPSSLCGAAACDCLRCLARCRGLVGLECCVLPCDARRGLAQRSVRAGAGGQSCGSTEHRRQDWCSAGMQVRTHISSVSYSPFQ